MKYKLLLLSLLVQSFLIAQDPNDECINAIAITVGSDFVPGTHIDMDVVATPSEVETPDCTYLPTSDDQDVWYSFVAPISGSVAIEESGNSALALYQGSCSELLYVDCINGSTLTSGLTAGETYYIKAFSFNSNFSVDIQLFSSSIPVNDDCAGATNVPVTADCTSMFFQYNTEATDGISLGGDCDDNDNRREDLWYQFIAPSNGSIEYEKNLASSSGYYFTVFENVCSNLIALDCNFNSGQTNGLIAGNSYFLRVANNDDFKEFCLYEGPPPPSNDQCSSPETVTVGIGTCGTNITGTLSGATATSNFTGCEASEYDVWYDFIAPTNGSITITNNLIGNIELGVYTNDCNNLIETDCKNINSSSDNTFTGLTPNSTYLIRVYESYLDQNFDFCVTEGDPPPGNDNCINAETAPYNSTIDTYTEFATPSNVSIPFCSDLSIVYDSWYAITPTTGTGNIYIDGSPSIKTALYEGSCGAQTLIQCYNKNSGERQFNGLVIGTTYYLRIWSTNNSNAQFSWYNNDSVSPANDDCTDATTITVGVGSCTSYTAINDGAVGSFEEVFPSCNDNAFTGGDLWYDFIAPSTGNISFLHESASTVLNIGIAIYEGNCGNLTEVYCDGEIDDGDYSYILGLTAGNSYKLRMWDRNFDEIEDILFCLEEGVASPPNDDCSDAITLTLSEGDCVTPIEVNNTSATESGIDASCTSIEGKDIWFSFVSPPSGSVIYEKLSGGDIYTALYEGTCTGLVEIDCNTFGDEKFFDDLITGETYYLRLFSVTGPIDHFDNSSFCLKIAPIPSNDLCSGATSLIVESGISCTNITEGYTFNSTDSGETTSACQYQTDIWYSFVSPASGTIDLNLQNSLYESYFQIYEGACGTLTSHVSCKELLPGTNLYGNLTPGETYLIKLWHEDDDAGYIDFCLLEGPTLQSNNICSNAIAVDVGDDECGIEVLATFDDVTPTYYSACLGGTLMDLWYDFIAPPSGSIEINYANYTGIDYNGIEIFSNDCSDLSSIQCRAYGLENGPIIIDDLTPGDTYLIMAFSESDAVDFCITGIPLPAINDDCVDANTILESTSETCENKISTSTYGGMDGFEDCESLSEEVFYTFTPSESSNYTIVTSNRSYDLNISIYNGNCTSDLLICSENEVTLPLEAGLNYTLAIATLDHEIFTDFELCIHKYISPEMTNIGINVSNPIQNLQVKDGIMIGNTSIDAPGSIRFNGSDIEGNLGSGWVSMTGNSSTITDNLGNHTATQELDLNGQKIGNLASPTLSSDAANKSYVDSHEDGDASTLNERISSLSLDGTMLTITESSYSKSIDLGSISESDNLGDHSATMNLVMNSNSITDLSSPNNNNDAANKAYVDAHVDADNDPNNEIETWNTLAGIPTDFLDGTDDVDDADNDPNNEIETWNTLAGIPADFLDGTDNVDDADNDPNNEIQTISIVDNDIVLTSGGTINLANLDLNKISDDDEDSHITFDNLEDQIILTANGVEAISVEEDSIYVAGTLQIGSGIGSHVNIGDETIIDGGANILRVEANLTPATTDVHNLGGNTFKWQNAYLSNKLFLNTGEIYEDGTDRLRTDSHWTPKNNAAKDLGESTLRWRDAHIDRFLYLNDSYLEGKSIGGNDVIEASSNFRPSTDNSAQLGSATRRWTEVFAANGVINTSDRRAKTNIQSLTYGLVEVMQLHAVEFDWKEKKNETKTLGLIAQDLQKIIPEVVVDSGKDELLGVKYTDLIPVLIKATQEQQLIIESQQKTLEQYVDTLAKYESRLGELESFIKSEQKTNASEED